MEKLFVIDGAKEGLVMSEESSKDSAAASDPSTRLAYERTYLAYERTQMGWVRTALSFISFGFAIDMFLREKRGEHAPPLSPRTVGILMIASGLASLVMASVQHLRALKTIRERCPGLPPSVSTVTAVLIGLLGTLALLNAILRHW